MKMAILADKLTRDFGSLRALDSLTMEVPFLMVETINVPFSRTDVMLLVQARNSADLSIFIDG